MSLSVSGALKLFSKRKALIAMAIAATLVATSAVAITAMSSPSAKTVLTIVSLSCVSEEAYVDENVEWTVVVEIQDQGQQGKGLLFTWDWGDGSYTVYDLKSVGPDSTATDVETHAWSDPGFYEVVVSVWDGYGTEDNPLHNVSQTAPFTVIPLTVNTPPSASFDVTPTEGTVGTVFFFDASSCSDLEDTVESIGVRWDWESDSVWDTTYSLEKTAEHQFAEAETYTVTLEAVDGGGLVDQTTREITVTAPVELLPHDPILIVGDEGFVPENGVVGGTGTLGNPYIIAGWSITPAEGDAITILDATAYFTIRDCVITGNIDTSTYGVYLVNVEHAMLVGLTISGFWMGVFAVDSTDITFTACESTWNSWGIFVLRCGATSITENEISHNIVGTGNQEGIMVQDTGYAYIARNNLADNFDGVFMYYVSSGCIVNNTMTENAVGVQALYSSCLMSGNSIYSKAWGIIMVGCPGTVIERNTVTTDPTVYDSFTGIEFMSCSDLSVSLNVVDAYHSGIRTDPSYYEYAVSDTVMISGNRISNCDVAAMSACYVSGLTVTANVFQSSGIGIHVDPSATGVMIYHNDFIDNAVQADEDNLCVGNEWDDGYPSGGNYWSDYQGVDEYSGAEQNTPGSDGIGDTPYVLMSGSQDDYPLMERYTLLVHEPIVISSDDEFTAENGVVGGSGTLDEPYVISGWMIETEDCSCIAVTHTRAYFEIRGVYLRTESHNVNVLYLEDVYNVYVGDSCTSGGMTGVTIQSCVSVEVADCDISENLYAFQAYSSSGFSLSGCDLSDSEESFYAIYSSGFSVTSCSMIANSIPCWTDRCEQGVFTGNHMESGSGSRVGAYLLDAHSMTFSGNQFVNCSIDIVGYELTNFSTHVISADNTVNGRPILFYEGLENLVLDGVDAGEVIIVGCRNVVVSNMTFYRGFAGVIVAYSSEATVENNVFTSCWIGTRVRGCSGVVVRGNNLTEVVGQGIGIWNTEGATVEDNELSSLGTFRYQDLMPIFHSSYVSLVNNTLTDSWQGVTAYFCSNLFISGNFISCMLSEGMHIGYSSVIEIIDSMFTGNGVGLSLEVCTGAKTYHNDFIGNTVQASDVNGTNNVWDNGYPGGGNYWNDYTGVDENGDGIGDTPYLIEGGAQDNYPLMTIYYAGWVAND